MLRDYLPTFHQLEPQNLKGLYAGDVVAQRPVAYTACGEIYGVATVSHNGAYFVENGVIMGLDEEAKLVNWAAGPMIVHFTEELPTILDAKGTFAVRCEEDETYPRGVILHAGDEFVTDNYVGSGSYALVSSGILTVSTANTSAKFAAIADTLADGTAAYRFIYLG